MLSESLEDKKNFVKEARILQDLQHPNIVKFQGICVTPFSLVLEYVYFDVQPFGINSQLSSLVDFLATLNDFECEGFDSMHIISGICKDTGTGLQYQKSVAQWDLKPANVLVSNQHCGPLRQQEIEKACGRVSFNMKTGRLQ